MRAKDLLKKYPEEWATIESGVWDDLQSIEKEKWGKKGYMFHVSVSPVHQKRIAYNAAFYAVCLLHKALKKKGD